VREDGSPLLIDFGLARSLEDDGERLTRTGVAVGTPHYMSPEQIRGIRADIDHLTDVWALGVILFELLSGERPFKGETTGELYSAI
ncbi:serine/threonine protein kinase, partial [Pseudomonas aeruginosa]